MLDEDEATGIRKYRYIKTGENHFSLAFTYAWLAAWDLLGPIDGEGGRDPELHGHLAP